MNFLQGGFMGNLKKLGTISVVVLTAVAILVGCATSGGSSAGAKNRDLPQYTQAGWKNAKIVGGGMIPGIIYNTSEKGVIYVRPDMGGAYRWHKESESWTPLTDFAGVEDYGRLGIASIATDPVEPNRVIMASGTYTNDWENGPMQMLVSKDYGDTFDRIDMYKSDGSPLKIGGNMPGRGCGERLAIDPNDNKTIYFGTNGDGLYRSRDYGYTWEEVTSFPTKGNVYDEGFATWSHFDHYFGIMWIVFDPASGKSGEGSKNIYCGVADTGNTIYESTDGGGIWKFDFATHTWTDISLPKHDPDPSRVTLDRGVGSVAVDWQNPNTLVACTLNEWWPDEYIYRSTDGGESWDAIWYMDGYPTLTGTEITGLDNGYPYKVAKITIVAAGTLVDSSEAVTLSKATNEGWTRHSTTYNFTEWDSKNAKEIVVSVTGNGSAIDSEVEATNGWADGLKFCFVDKNGVTSAEYKLGWFEGDGKTLTCTLNTVDEESGSIIDNGTQSDWSTGSEIVVQKDFAADAVTGITFTNYCYMNDSGWNCDDNYSYEVTLTNVSVVKTE